MGQQHIIYGLDIETDTRCDGLDPSVAAVVTVALSGATFDEVFVGDEATLLQALDARLASLPYGVLATWNGAAFDLPFIADRARLLGIPLGLHLCLDRRLTLERAPLPGHAGAYRGSWHGHSHLDTYRLFGGAAAPNAHWLRLRSLARILGVGEGGSTTRRTHDLTNEALHAHAASDARLARVLAERRWSTAHRLVDRIGVDEAEPVSVAAHRLERRARAGERVLVHPAAATA
jgi:hypothetical protein